METEATDLIRLISFSISTPHQEDKKRGGNKAGGKKAGGRKGGGKKDEDTRLQFQPNQPPDPFQCICFDRK